MQNTVLWEASEKFLQSSLLFAFKHHLEQKFDLKFHNYDELHLWSVKYYQSFWRELLHWSGIVFEGSTDIIFQPNGRNFYGGKWFPQVSLNYAENLLSNLADVPLRSFYENNILICELPKAELLGAVKYFQGFFKEQGLAAGDKVAAFVGNNQLSVVAMLAAASLGASWSSCSPDFGEQGVLDRFEQVQAKFFLYDDETVYAGKCFDLSEKIEKIKTGLESKSKVQSLSLRKMWKDFSSKKPEEKRAVLGELKFTRVPFMAPLYILFSSGTTGVPKCIVHSVGGTLLQHVKELQLHSDLKKSDRFFYYTTTGWMMWNWMVSGLFAKSEVYTLEGAPLVGEWSLWDFVEKNKITAFGTSARFISACKTKGMNPKITAPRITFSTGSALLPEDFDYYYSTVDPAKKSQLASISGGTDIVSCFMLGNPWKPVRRGEIQGAGLAMEIDAFDENGFSARNRDGELVCKSPFPSMPTQFVNDPGNKKFEDAYFKKFPNVWHHGDFVTITDEGGVIMHGRSDATLNPGGVRIGTAEIYRVMEQLPEVSDSLVVGQDSQGDEKVILFVKLSGGELSEELKAKIKKTLREKASPRHVPDFIYLVDEIPYTLSGKKVEIAVKKILKGEEPKNIEALQNPQSLKQFHKYATSKS
jgi:acetoacetyl-CoA synthetase